ncbi:MULTISPECIES: CDP-alcohol phosphatidyltransferase family protein [unclassified Streptomyces]|uniref:CDP-alcohol phosphatidyltransferase family protein n=1 Tax=unclassified Streptomyces TaxID=2593676 RepID=UPI001F049269|nr:MULTISPECIES: CDP-alcohol phosphatidyltransferase family protein [unclassified Streptomyces]MCH0565948.1 CDP-alcohol phosphatidyltransferase family protein [Streptomyces sp. MUM 2J]MCH0569113.1 CDP-alcohol phosphatidyltransferase family protein [Streptomyces sp. MUM 136J]
MDSLLDQTDSRAATNALLAEVRGGRFRPAAVGSFLALAVRRSLRQAARRPRALAELTLLHGALYVPAYGRRPGRRWVTTSWALAVLHLGLLEHRTRLTLPDALTLVRANLPALPGSAHRACGMLAIGLDVADGRLARRRGTVSPFGAYADTFADAAFWMWLTLRHEPDRAVRAAAVAAWAFPVTAVTGLALYRGAMPEQPRPVLLRPAAALQIVVALRRLARR